jgi:hypothetical protein
MLRADHDGPGLLVGTNPNRSGTSSERERVVADDLPGAAEIEHNRVVRNRTDTIELISYAKHDARSIRTIGNQFVIVGDGNKLAIDTRDRSGP